MMYQGAEVYQGEWVVTGLSPATVLWHMVRHWAGNRAVRFVLSSSS